MSTGTPSYTGLGGKDSSSGGQILGSVKRGQLVLNAFGFTAKGPAKAEGTITDIMALYGENSFDPMSKFYTHSTRFTSRFGASGGKIVMNRAIPSDAKAPANIAVYIDVLATDLPNYLRDSLGNTMIDSDTNMPKVDADTPTIPGYKIKFIEEHSSAVGEYAPELRMLVPKDGTMDNGSGVKSRMYPFMQANARYRGGDYNLCGFGFNSIGEDDLDFATVAENKAMMYDLVLYKKPNANSNVQIFRTLFQENSAACTLKEKTVNPATTAALAFEQVFRSEWYNESTSTGIDLIKYNDYEDIHIYRKNLELILGLIKNSEKEHISSEVKIWEDGLSSPTTSWFDFASEELEDEEYLFNLFTCKSSKNVPYFTVMISDDAPTLVDTQKEINITKNTPIMLKGGSDGTVSNAELNQFVTNRLSEYGDAGSLLQDPIIAPENFFVDSGFDLDTKKAAFNFIGLRKDTCVLLSTYDYTRAKDGHELSLSEQASIVKSLSSRAQLSPESPYFGTKCCRAAVPMGSGKVNVGDIERVPATYIIMGYMADMMSALNGKWKKDKIFDDSCYAIELVDVEPRGIPNPMKTVLWNTGAIFPIPTDRNYPKYAGLQTLYPDPTSVMNNIFTMVALATCDRIARLSWLDLSGNLRDTPAKFLDRASINLLNKHNGIFAGMYVSIPKPYFTAKDTQAGNRWSVVTELKGNVAKTECSHYTNVTRLGDE